LGNGHRQRADAAGGIGIPASGISVQYRSSEVMKWVPLFWYLPGSGNGIFCSLWYQADRMPDILAFKKWIHPAHPFHNAGCEKGFTMHVHTAGGG
jgi:hypothetical protein